MVNDFFDELVVLCKQIITDSKTMKDQLTGDSVIKEEDLFGTARTIAKTVVGQF